MATEEYVRQQQQVTCMSFARQHVKRELWSYFALAGLFFIYLGAIIIVYAVKGVFSAHAAMTFCGVFLAGAGAVNLIASCVFYRHHRHHHQSLSCLSDKDEEAKASSKSPAPRERSRLQGPNLPVFLTPSLRSTRSLLPEILETRPRNIACCSCMSPHASQSASPTGTGRTSRSQ
ncbi:uncharacterized protein LOC112573703 [Pomacea canaliculata]|uniref:uncharacterized protein LOC112573703 n=1 Tax=Pomacea canaliculata TaxID=400727 RepID=UPI000D73C71E|nr:uncharacterized protein LOC112573703 [Pomacea canaliculata]